MSDRPELAPPPPDTNEPANPGMLNFSDLEGLAQQAQATSSDVEEGQGDVNQEQFSTEPQPPDVQDKVATDIPNLVSELGFKSPEELKKSFKEQHATITRLSQERSNMSKEMEAFKQLVMSQMAQTQHSVMPQGQATDLNAELYKEIAPFVQQEVVNAVKMTTATNKIMSKRSENPEEFDDLKPYMIQIIQQNPHLEMMPDGLDQAYDKAKAYRDSYVRTQFNRVLGVDIDKLRAVLAGQEQTQGQGGNLSAALATAATVPTSTPGSNTPMSEKKIDYTSEIKKAQQSGDIDRVVQLTVMRDSRKTNKK